jgi:Flp pilus assembly pilin Flp
LQRLTHKFLKPIQTFSKETQAQDVIEYALMAGFVAVAAGAIMPGVASEISTLFSKISSALTAAGA